MRSTNAETPWAASGLSSKPPRQRLYFLFRCFFFLSTSGFHTDRPADPFPPLGTSSCAGKPDNGRVMGREGGCGIGSRKVDTLGVKGEEQPQEVGLVAFAGTLVRQLGVVLEDLADLLPVARQQVSLGLVGWY